MIQKQKTALVFLTVASLLFSTSLLGQDTLLKGIVIDKDSELRIADAHISSSEGTLSTTNPSGEFTLLIKQFPVKLKISHLSYGEMVFTVSKIDKKIMVFQLELANKSISAVEISAERQRILNKSKPIFVKDFAFDQRNLWFIGSLNKKADQTRLWAASYSGDTLESFSISADAQLKGDVFNNVHLSEKDTMHQLLYQSDSIFQVDRIPTSLFRKEIGPIKALLSNSLIYSSYQPGQEGLHFYSISKDTAMQKLLSVVRDVWEEDVQEYEYVNGYCGSVMTALNTMEFGEERLKIALARKQRFFKRKSVINKRVVAPCIADEQHFYLFNLYEDSLLVFDSKLNKEKAISIDFHKVKSPLGIHYKQFKLLNDHLSKEAYIIFKEGNIFTLAKLSENGIDPHRTRLPELSTGARIEIAGGRAYFLELETIYPFYTRIYSLRL